MSASPEPLAAILAEMRNPPHKWEPSRADLAALADRIEAAAKRFREAVQGARDMRDAMEYAFAQKTPKVEQSGNAAVLREALEKARRYFNRRGEGTNLDDAGMAIDAITSIDAALAAPARNCDVGTMEEQAERFIEFCKGHLCDNCPNQRAKRCGIGWSQMPFAPAEGGAE